MRTRPPLSAAAHRRLSAAFAAALACTGIAAGSASAAFNGGAPAYVPGEVVVGYTAESDARVQASAARAVGASASAGDVAGASGTQGNVAGASGTQGDVAGAPRTRVLHVAPGRVRATVIALRRQPGVAYAAPNPIARISAAGSYGNPGTRARTSVVPLPDDVGIKGFPGGLAALQWNFFDPLSGVNALEAWTNAIEADAEGGYGVRVAVLDTGVAYRDYGRYKRSPDFAFTKFVAPYDFVEDRREAVDRNGHGTHVTGTIAESTNNRIGVAGLAYRSTIMPIRVLDSQGYGDAATIAKGIRYAARHNAKVINMSLEFSTSVRSSEIPDIMAAIRFANAKGAVIVGSTGNEGEAQVAYPARATTVLSVGATTDAACLSSFSNDGAGLDLVAPGGGDNAALSQDPNCVPDHRGRDVYQMTYDGGVGAFGLPAGYDGTSMAAPHVSAAAALVIATGVIGAKPTPAQVECRLKATARALGIPGPNRIYGWGLVDAGAATSPLVASASCLSRSARANPR